MSTLWRNRIKINKVLYIEGGADMMFRIQATDSVGEAASVAWPVGDRLMLV